MASKRGRPTAIESRHRKGVAIQRASGSVARRQSLPEYLEQGEIEALIQAAHGPRARLLMLIQWRAGLRVSEALTLQVGDLQLNGDRPTLRVRHGTKGVGQGWRRCILSCGRDWSMRWPMATSNVVPSSRPPVRRRGDG